MHLVRKANLIHCVWNQVGGNEEHPHLSRTSSLFQGAQTLCRMKAGMAKNSTVFTLEPGLAGEPPSWMQADRVGTRWIKQPGQQQKPFSRPSSQCRPVGEP